ncbi:alkyl hydroperoxide reductase/ Thiol specific antioxidant/ Mal allergen [Cellulomonas flavigena DSM 20109]|uniref:Alkyl hydroperoxide reductase E n=1 Tax=Cellulomonas flavigena (strain ATCC 482 / DSM 20109 / BCRC 11376 / JCM 18109 / NBRC 3775 / NCIMB 8073 / NRS 134) TaxID=446466 RepID=D5UG16_CELFN|nr:peroxiredoxin [Cellulomonas flavigena]ADG75039.1 alkyl hydroperoxide reductase/ Thiol specific antioxidant/ Mal allergen [Cellulomonas flavigena DSM 20109]
MTPPAPGSPAPDLTLPDTHGTPVTLSGLRGTPVAIVFVPFAFSGTCTGELCELRDNIAAFDEAGVRLLVVSCDPMFALRAWAEQEGYTFDLLSDFWPHGAAARAYGVLDETSGHALRGSFLVDADGVVRWSVVNPRGQARPLAAYRQALAALTA